MGKLALESDPTAILVCVCVMDFVPFECVLLTLGSRFGDGVRN